MNTCTVDTTMGPLSLVEENGHITKLLWHAEENGVRTPVLETAAEQLKAYFDGELETFDLPLAPAGTDFQQQVYAAMLAIPKGETRTYGDIANDLGVPAQPVGQACGSNPIPIIIPCHRVVGSDGLGGFSGCGGVETKVQLLQHEGAYSLLI
ncbi:MAG: methylated-DNA--[protein]-cysteine S-methyltransferase [Hyphomicrobiales bacterium]|nr:methylated-DNA--[protein]-cysteine S-methyltransferase [Hyphomicrobiales bacterium]